MNALARSAFREQIEAHRSEIRRRSQKPAPEVVTGEIRAKRNTWTV